jgi:hypothetical protein
MNFAFIFMMKGCDPQKDRTELEYCGNRLLICGVSSIEEGQTVAKECVDKRNVKFIELCYDFGKNEARGAKAIIEAVDGRIPVGYVTCFPEDVARIENL